MKDEMEKVCDMRLFAASAGGEIGALRRGSRRAPPRRLVESLARPLRARGRPVRTERVRAAEVCGYFVTGERTGVCGNYL